MAPLEIHLAGPEASVSTQTSLVQNVQGDVGRRQMDLLSLIAGIVLQKRQLTDTDKEEFMQRRMSIEFVKQNLRTLREEWAKVGVKAVFPERVVNEKLTQAERLIDQCMDEDGVTTDEFEQTLAANAVNSLEVGAAATDLESNSPVVASTLGQAQQTDSETRGLTDLGTLVIKSLSDLTGLFEDEEYQKLPSKPFRTSLPVHQTQTDGDSQADRRRRSALPQSIGKERRISVVEKKRSGNRPSALQIAAYNRGGGGGDDDDDPDDPRRDNGGSHNGRGDPSGPTRHGQRYMPQLRSSRHDSEFDRELYWEIPSFTGDYLDFPEFFDLFQLVVHNTNLPGALKLNFLRLKLDPRTRRMIRCYRGHDYLRALQAITDEYSSLASVVAHVQRRALALPPVTQRDDLEGLIEVVEQLRAINSLFDYYDLSMGLEMEIFRIFLSKLPECFSDKYLRKMRNDTPSLSIYLEHLDDAVATVRTRRLWLPQHAPGEGRFLADRGRVCDSLTFALGPTASKRQWVNHADWRDRDLEVESKYYVEEVESEQGDEATDWHSRPPTDRSSGQPTTFRQATIQYGRPYSACPQLAAYACLQKSDSVRSQQLGHARPQRPLGAPLQPLVNRPPHSIEWNDKEREGASRAVVPYDRPIRFPCLTCGAPDHSRLCCNDVSLEEKLDLVRMFRLCYLCLKRGHNSAACTSKLRCKRCGGEHHTQLCVCSYPSREGNPSRPPHMVHKVEDEQEAEEMKSGICELYEDFCGKDTDSGGNRGRVLSVSPGGVGNNFITLPFTFGENTLVGLLDTGATVNLMPAQIAEELQLTPYSSAMSLTVPGGKLHTFQAVKLAITIGEIQREVEFQLHASANRLIILGMKVFTGFQLITDYLKKVYQSTSNSFQYFEPLETPDDQLALSALTDADNWQKLNTLLRGFQPLPAPTAFTKLHARSEHFQRAKDLLPTKRHSRPLN